LTLILMAGGLVIIWILAYIVPPGAVGTEYHWMANVLWSGMTFLGGLMILVPHETPSEPVEALWRLKCPHCAAVYAYDEQEGIETGFVRCQNCDREFGPTADKQASQASSIR
ncbi:MAG: MJ0042-type zinc finger domain-containing protein, partial [Promethearchaeota archaeon]